MKGFGKIPIIIDPDCPPGKIYLLPASALERFMIPCQDCEEISADVKNRLVLVPGASGYHYEEMELCDDCLEERQAGNI